MKSQLHLFCFCLFIGNCNYFIHLTWWGVNFVLSLLLLYCNTGSMLGVVCCRLLVSTICSKFMILRSLSCIKHCLVGIIVMVCCNLLLSSNSIFSTSYPPTSFSLRSIYLTFTAYDQRSHFSRVSKFILKVLPSSWSYSYSAHHPPPFHNHKFLQKHDLTMAIPNLNISW